MLLTPNQRAVIQAMNPAMSNSTLMSVVALIQREEELANQSNFAMKSSPTSGFKFGKSSEAELVGVLPQFVAVIRLALTLSIQDYCVYDGLRTLKEQRAHIKAGTSRTMNSKHLPQSDGFSHASDLVPWIAGGPKWDWDGCAKIAHAMDHAATQLGVANHIVWGGAWDRRLSDFGGELPAYMAEVEAYKIRHAGKDFIDGPHFEWRD